MFVVPHIKNKTVCQELSPYLARPYRTVCIRNAESFFNIPEMTRILPIRYGLPTLASQ